jgi:hypothetical protein
MILGLAFTIASFVPMPSRAQIEPSLPISISVQGQSLTMEDIGDLINGLYSHDAPTVEYVDKNPTQMPSDACSASYQGRIGSPPREIIWVSTRVQGNMVFVRVKAEPAVSSLGSPNTIVPCDDTTDRSSADWPFRNEPLPKVEEGPCADARMSPSERA